MSFYCVRSSALLALVVLYSLIPSAQAQFAQQGPKLVGTGAVGSPVFQGYSVSISADGNTAIVGGPYDNNFTGAAWVFTRSGGVWTQQGNKLVGTGGVGQPQQAFSVSISADGNTAIVGGWEDNNQVGAAWVFARSDGVWTQQGDKLIGTGAVGPAAEGRSVSISADGNTAIVGGLADNENTGAAWVFTRSGGVWTQQGTKLVGTGGIGEQQQGSSVAVSGDGNTAIVGGDSDSSTGASWVFTRSGGVWTQQGNKLVGTGGVNGGAQGWSVSISANGNTAIVGGPDDNGANGAAWVFTRSDGVWTQQGNKLVGTGAVGNAIQGSGVSISADGNTAVVGGRADNREAGATWAFTRSGGIWTQLGGKLVGTGAVGMASQGFSVAISGDSDTVAVGGFSDLPTGATWMFTQAPRWTGLTNRYPGSGAGPCLVLTDGTVACNNSQSNSNQWYRLTPDRTGSYLNGTWSAMPNMPYQPVFYASAVLPNGQLIIQGGEYLNGQQTWTNQGAVYEPKTNSWTPVICNVIPSGQLGDSQSVIFPDGTFMIANISNTQVATAAPATDFTTCGPLNNCYTLLSPIGKDDSNGEEGWTLLPNGDILTVDAVSAPNTQTYHQANNAWSVAGTTGNSPPCDLADPSSQLGPQVLRPDGTAVAFGAFIAPGHAGACSAIYDTVGQTWTLGPDFPAGLDVAEGPGSPLLNGNVLVMASPGVFQNGAQFFEWDGANLNPVPSPPNALADSSYVGHMVVLPTGEVMFTDFTTDVELYATSGTYQASWRPVITGIPFLKNHVKLLMNATYEIDGLQFNGLSQGAAYGDDLQTATNYPLVRATQLFGGGNTVYFRTHDHSTMGVATGSTPVSTMFDIPNATVPGLYSLVVVANGIPSQPKTVVIGCSLSTAVDAHACTN